MRSTYIASDNTGTGGVALGGAQEDVELLKIVVGAPVASGNIYVFSITNPGGTSNANLVAKFTLPASLATGQLPFVLDLTDADGEGFVIPQGGNVMIDQTMQVTVGWQLKDR